MAQLSDDAWKDAITSSSKSSSPPTSIPSPSSDPPDSDDTQNNPVNQADTNTFNHFGDSSSSSTNQSNDAENGEHKPFDFHTDDETNLTDGLNPSKLMGVATGKDLDDIHKAENANAEGEPAKNVSPNNLLDKGKQALDYYKNPTALAKDAVNGKLGDKMLGGKKNGPLKNDDTDRSLFDTGDEDLDRSRKRAKQTAKQVGRTIKAVKSVKPLINLANKLISMALQLYAAMKVLQAIQAFLAMIARFFSWIIKMIVTGVKAVAGFIKSAAIFTASALKSAFITAPITTVAIVTVSASTIGIGSAAAYQTFANNNQIELQRKMEEEYCGQEAKEKENGKPSIGDLSGASGGEWTVKGSKSYVIAETVFKILTKDYGMSGTAAAGWLGNIQAESGFNVSAIEGENGQNYSGRGYGLFQFTPGSKYLNSPYYKKGASVEEEIKHQIEFVFNSEINNGSYRPYLKNAADWFGIKASGLEDILDNNDPENSMLVFFAVYERGDIALMHRDRRSSAAKKANELFNTEKIKADRSKWPKSGNVKPGDAASSSDSKSNDHTKGEDVCGTKKDETSGELGKASSKDVQAALEKLKKDVDAARPIGNGECYGLTSQYVYYLSGHNIGAGISSGSPVPISPTPSSNPRMFASNIGQDYDWKSVGYSVKSNASAKDIQVGDIVNTKSAGAADGGAGHTVVVAKVNGDGTFLLFEQNYAGRRYAVANTRNFPEGTISSIVRYNGKK